MQGLVNRDINDGVFTSLFCMSVHNQWMPPMLGKQLALNIYLFMPSIIFTERNNAVLLIRALFPGSMIEKNNAVIYL